MFGFTKKTGLAEAKAKDVEVTPFGHGRIMSHTLGPGGSVLAVYEDGYTEEVKVSTVATIAPPTAGGFAAALGARIGGGLSGSGWPTGTGRTFPVIPEETKVFHLCDEIIKTSHAYIETSWKYDDDYSQYMKNVVLALEYLRQYPGGMVGLAQCAMSGEVSDREVKKENRELREKVIKLEAQLADAASAFAAIINGKETKDERGMDGDATSAGESQPEQPSADEVKRPASVVEVCTG